MDESDGRGALAVFEHPCVLQEHSSRCECRSWCVGVGGIGIAGGRFVTPSGRGRIWFTGHGAQGAYRGRSPAHSRTTSDQTTSSLNEQREMRRVQRCRHNSERISVLKSRRSRRNAQPATSRSTKIKERYLLGSRAAFRCAAAGCRDGNEKRARPRSASPARRGP